MPLTCDLSTALRAGATHLVHTRQATDDCSFISAAGVDVWNGQGSTVHAANPATTVTTPTASSTGVCQGQPPQLPVQISHLSSLAAATAEFARTHGNYLHQAAKVLGISVPAGFCMTVAECKGRRATEKEVERLKNESQEDYERRKAFSNSNMENSILFSGNANAALAESVANHLDTTLGRVSLKRFADGEVSLQFLESIRGKNVFIIQPTAPPVNENLMELLLMISTCRRASAKAITAVIPYYGYARQDRKLSSRVPISAADVARMIESMGADRVVAVDLHCGQIQGFFGPRVPVDNLEASVIGQDYFAAKKLQSVVVVSPDAGGVYRAKQFQEGIAKRGVKEVGLAMLIKQRAKANEIERMDLVGSVEGVDVIIVDDMIDTAGTLCEAARELRKKGAKRVFAFATHGLFSGPAISRIENSPLEETVVTDTITGDKNKDSPKITRLSISMMIADAIRRINNKESLKTLFHK